jgi:hypothetical protein
MKLVDPARFAMGSAEARFYEFVAASGLQPPDSLLDVYGTLIDDERRLAVVLMAEEEGPFVQSDWPVPPALEDCLRAVRALARIHARWRDSPEAAMERQRRAPGNAAMRQRIEDCARALIDRLGDALAPERRALIERVVERFPDAHAARLDAGGLTLVHGDAHFWNFLIPKDPTRQPVLIDWQLWGVDLGAADLAYMIALHWFPDRRARYEQTMLDGYRDELERLGIDCGAEALQVDYRFMVAGLLTRLVVFASVIPAGIWWPHLYRAFAAFDDLDCAELLGGRVDRPPVP